MAGIDIHNYEKRYDAKKRAVVKADISKRNKELILNFERCCFLKEGISKSRLIQLMNMLVILGRDYNRCDFDKIDQKGMDDMVFKIASRSDLSPWTRQSYKAAIKKFFKWLEHGDDYKKIKGYPPLVSWIKTSIKRKDQPRVRASDLLTEDEVKRLIRTAEHPRDKAIVAMLYELGARIGEIGGLRIKDVCRDDHSYVVDLHGKTGHRTPRIVFADPFLTRWLEDHPLSEEPEAPLWVVLGNRNKNRYLKYSAFQCLLKRLIVKAGINKRIHPHLFRHTRVTHLLLNKEINEPNAKVFFGWVPDSNMLAEYSHLLSRDVNQRILEIHGIKPEEEKKSPLGIKQCPRCKSINPNDARFCHLCSGIMNTKVAIQLDEWRGKVDGILNELFKDSEVQQLLAKKINEKGLRDRVLDAIP